MEASLQELTSRLNQLSDQYRELRDGVQKAIRIADDDPEMALTRARKVLEYVVRDVFEHRIKEPPGTRPLENLLDRLVKDHHFPVRLDAYANTVRKLGNVGTHSFTERITAADVYQSLTQLMPILEWYFAEERPDAGVSLGLPHRPEEANRTKPADAVPISKPAPPRSVEPKGLRSFDANDSDAFLQLLPGARDKDGLPESIGFWKHRLETTDEPTFTVGVIYGPSGCGKTSLVKAGLLPRLSETVIPIYIEATADQTEARLLHGLKKQFPALPGALGLHQSVAALRQGNGLQNNQKVVIVLDQFEQWLHANRQERETELAQALRQCDGDHVQCILLVRDDFWVALSRFMETLQIELVQGQNTALVDLFELRHAKKVLTAFGRAFGALPDNLSKEQESYLDQAVTGLAQDGRRDLRAAGAVCRHGQRRPLDTADLEERRRHGRSRRHVPGKDLWRGERGSEAPPARESGPSGPPSAPSGARHEHQRQYALAAGAAGCFGVRRPPGRFQRTDSHSRQRSPPHHADRSGRRRFRCAEHGRQSTVLPTDA